MDGIQKQIEYLNSEKAREKSLIWNYAVAGACIRYEWWQPHNQKHTFIMAQTNQSEKSWMESEWKHKK